MTRSYLQCGRAARVALCALYFLGFLVCFSLPITVMYTHAEQLTLAWDANSEPTLAGYKVYWGTSSANYSWSADAGAQTTYTVVELSPGATYYFAATAYDSARSESSFSSEKAYTVPATCTNTITPTSQVLGAGGGTGSINITTAGTCNWTTSNTSSWVSITSGASGTGNGTVSFNVSENTGTASRTAGLTVAGNIFTVSQSGQPAPTCTYALSASSRSFGAPAGSGSAAVTAPSGCAWSSSGAPEWISVTSGASGNGNGTFSYTVAANTLTGSRSATLTIAGKQYTVSQSGAQATYTITATAGASGSISPAGSSVVSAGTSKTFTITPAPGFKIQSVQIDGASAGSVSSYTFTDVRANHTIQATFKQLPRSKTTRVMH